MYNLLHSLPSSGGSIQDRLIARYRLLLARDLIRKDPVLIKELEMAIDEFHGDSLARDPRFANEEEKDRDIIAQKLTEYRKSTKYQEFSKKLNKREKGTKSTKKDGNNLIYPFARSKRKALKK